MKIIEIKGERLLSHCPDWGRDNTCEDSGLTREQILEFAKQNNIEITKITSGICEACQKVINRWP